MYLSKFAYPAYNINAVRFCFEIEQYNYTIKYNVENIEESCDGGI